MHARLAGGCPALVSSQSRVVLSDSDRVLHRANFYDLGLLPCDVVDASTRQMVSHKPYRNLTADTSGALLWRGERGTLMVSSGLAGDQRVLQAATPSNDGRSLFFHSISRFRFGIAFVKSGNQHCVLRFDSDPTAPDCETAR